MAQDHLCLSDSRRPAPRALSSRTLVAFLRVVVSRSLWPGKLGLG